MASDKIVSISAAAVTICSLAFVAYQTALMRETAYAAVLPYLQISYSTQEDGSFINVANRGVGPALIDEINVSYQGEVIPGDPYQYYSVHKNPDVAMDGLYVDRILQGMLIPSGSLVRTLGTTNSKEQAADIVKTFNLAGLQADPAANKAVIEIVYSSVFGEQWRIRSNQVIPEKID